MIGTLAYWLALAAGAGFTAFAGRARDVLVLGLSLILIAQWDLRAVAVVLALMGVVLAAAPRLGPDRPHNTLLTRGLVVFLVLTLVGFRQLLPLTGHAALAIAPLGLSYFAFKLIHVVVELSRGSFGPPQPLRFAQYLLLFPAFLAGPIERWDNFTAGRRERLTRDDIAFGLTRIAHGLIKKFCIAELVGTRLLALVSVDSIAHAEHVPPTWRLWGHIIGNLVYLYFDFSGYSDLALGGSALLGYRLQENFDRPFLATNITEWWRRWHISLLRWCMDYVYMPMLGLTRRPILAGYCSMFVMGMWHNVSPAWAIWGLIHGTSLALYQRLQMRRRRLKIKPKPPAFAKRQVLRLVTVGAVIAPWAFTLTDKLGLYAGLRFFLGLFGVGIPA